MKLIVVFLYSFLYRDHFAEGYRLYELKRFEEALAAYDMGIKHNPTDSVAYNNKGACLDELNRLNEALASYDMALIHNPNYELAINNRKDLLEKLKSK